MGRVRGRGVSSAVAQTDVQAEGVPGGGGFRNRKPRGMSVDTRTGSQGRGQGQGLGILLPTTMKGDEPAMRQKQVKNQVSFDPSTIRSNPPCRSLEAATAPLPQTKSFPKTPNPFDDDCSSDSDDEEILRCPDIETGHPMSNTRDLNDHYADRRASPYFNTGIVAGTEEEEDDKGQGWLGKVNQGVYKVADRLSATFYEQVNGAEEGLLLPVRESEREGALGRVVG